MTSAHSSQVKNTLASSNWAIGVVAPKRYSMQGSAKNSTKPLSPANRLQRQHAPARRDVAGQHQREERER